MFARSQFLKLLFITLFASSFCFADENLFGYVKGAEPLPKGSWEIYQSFTSRKDKGVGTYEALDLKTEFEYGLTDNLAVETAIQMQSVKSEGILMDAYIPEDINTGIKTSGIELALKYNFLSPAKDDLGVSAYFSLDQGWSDSHSGQKKDTTSFEALLMLQKYFMEGQAIWATNFGIESTRAKRYAIDNLPSGFEWPTEPEMEIELKAATAFSYRFIPNWFVGGELSYESEYETEVDQERWSTFLGPNLHYGDEKWWATLTYFPQLEGGGPRYAGQTDTKFHLIEKTKQEIRFKIGLNF